MSLLQHARRCTVYKKVVVEIKIVEPSEIVQVQNEVGDAIINDIKNIDDIKENKDNIT